MSDMSTADPSMSAPAGDFGSRIRHQREDAHLSLIDLMIEVRARLPRSKWVTHETLRGYENGTRPEDRADPVVVAALADVFGCRVEDLSPLVAEAADVIRELLVKLSDSDGGGHGLPRRKFAWSMGGRSQAAALDVTQAACVRDAA